MTWGAVASAGANLVGGMLSSRAASKASDKQAKMMEEQRAALKEASKWKATGTTNRYGSSAQIIDATTGALTGANWNMSPEMKAYQDRLQAGAGASLPDNFDPEAATQAQYQLLKNQQAPGVERGYSGLLSNLMGKGTLGLSTDGTTGLGGAPALGQANPQLEAYFNAVAQQDAANLTGAQTQVRSMMDSDIRRSSGLMGDIASIEDRGLTSLDKTIGWSKDQRDATMRGAGAVASQSNMMGDQIVNTQSGGGAGSFLQGLGSNPAFGKTVAGLFGTKASPSVPTYGGGPVRPPGATW